MNGTIQFSIDFYNTNSASVFLEKEIFGGKTANEYGELLLLSCLTLRHVVNLGQTDPKFIALANILPTTYEEVLRFSQQIDIIPNRRNNKSKKFRGILFFDSQKVEVTFRLYLKGYGLFGRHIRPYILPSITAMIAYLVQLHQEEKLFLLKLTTACALCRDTVLDRDISSREHIQLAAQIATRSIDEYDIFDIWNRDELIDIWIKWQAHKVPSSYEDKCYKFYQTVITNFDDVLVFFLERKMITEYDHTEYASIILRHTAQYYRMLFLSGLNCAANISSDNNEQEIEDLISRCYDVLLDLLKPARKIIESLLAINVGPNSASRIEDLILNTWQLETTTARTCFLDGMTYGMKIKSQ